MTDRCRHIGKKLERCQRVACGNDFALFTKRSIVCRVARNLLHMEGLQLFQERLSNKTVCDNAESFYGKWGFTALVRGFRCFCDIEGNSTKKLIYAFSSLVGKHREPQSIKAKLFLPIIPIGIVAYAFMLLWDNLCRNSCIRCRPVEQFIAIMLKLINYVCLKFLTFFS